MSQVDLSPEAIARKLDITLNPMQEAMIAACREQEQLLLLSPTGSGKTLAFLLPLISSLDPSLRTTQAMVIAPSRELAIQIAKVFRTACNTMKLTLCYGGHKRETEENDLIEAPIVIVGTPGRLADHIRRGNIKTEAIRTLVLDEFDKSLELGFHEEVAFVAGSLPAVQQKMLISATEGAVPDFMEMDEPFILDFLPEEREPAPRLTVQQVLSPDKDKSETLFHLVCTLSSRPMIIFCNHRDAVERTAMLLKDKGISCVFYHGAMEQREREQALCKFRNGSTLVLVTTDIAARGLDVPHIRYIIHYHLPHTEEMFTHRNGRTARMEASGTAILITGPDETVPEYAAEGITELEVQVDAPLPEKPKWTTLYVDAGKKNKVNKVDILGFLAQKGELKKEDIGLIEVSDFHSFVAVRKSKLSYALQQIRDERLKNKKVKIEIAK
jgi:ATP-dependent RNA helicase DeaD